MPHEMIEKALQAQIGALGCLQVWLLSFPTLD
jgi:hypothetical protein